MIARSTNPPIWPPEPQAPAPILMPASYDKGPAIAPKTTANIGFFRNQDKDSLIVVASKAQRVHIQSGER